MIEVPAQMRIKAGVHWAAVACQREGCDWQHDVSDDHLTEVVAVAAEHIQEAHRG